MKDYMVINAKIVTPHEVINNGCVLIRNGIIECIEECCRSYVRSGSTVFDAKGKWLLPGIVDLRSDVIEKEMEPKRGVFMPLKIVLFSLENRFLLHGVTSIYHSLTVNDVSSSSDVHNTDGVFSNIKGINNLKRYGLLRHFVNARYDITGKKFCPKLMEVVDTGNVNVISFVNHKDEYEERVNKDVEKTNDPQLLDFIDLLAEKAKKHKIPIMTYYDDSHEEIVLMKSDGVTISELPLDFKSAEKEGQYVVVGAPNIVNEDMNAGNMRYVDAVKSGGANILCSDYVPSSIIHAIFVLHYKHGINMYSAVNMATLNPAKAAGIDDKLGSIECGKQADLVLVGDRIPFVEQMFVNGKRILCMERNNMINRQLWATV